MEMGPVSLDTGLGRRHYVIVRLTSTIIEHHSFKNLYACTHSAFINIQQAFVNAMLLYTHTAIKCSQLDPISNGMISYSPDSVVGSYDLATIATHSCNEGFYLSGAITRECIGDISSSFGSWNGRSAPTCMGNLYNVMFHDWSSFSWQHTCMTLVTE